ncbi:hypothetical protein JF73_17180 (plasmid) [Lactobacillus helsingborgensis]|uniref:Uncharacterized protein n=1 Tax=Lactobacillus helsingborgensis TaxID=1218494 RepID=A0AA47GHP4_9LACO|nr:hypothetical protein [Lactobacillus helsingborgensis]KJY60546.1 hypothetical protein JF73_17180 [Lactobacillus helsingborgensis]UZX30590.1 hypothetical protein LDX53_08880 [Lactobacillus helsingborgensis]
MDQYIILNKSMLDDVTIAINDYLALLSNLNDIILYSNFILTLKEKLEKGAMFKVHAINSDVECIIGNQKYIIEYESDKKIILSIFVFIEKTFESVRKNLALNYNDSVKPENYLLSILNKLEI